MNKLRVLLTIIVIGFIGFTVFHTVLVDSEVSVPAAGILFASALFGAGIFGRRKKKSTSSNVMVGAFTRAS